MLINSKFLILVGKVQIVFLDKQKTKQPPKRPGARSPDAVSARDGIAGHAIAKKTPRDGVHTPGHGTAARHSPDLQMKYARMTKKTLWKK